MMKTPLILTVTSEKVVHSRSAPIPLTVMLHNESTVPSLINARMGVGYEDSVIRELYFTVYTAGG